MKTVHTGFFANQGSVATIGSPSDSGSVGSAAGGKGSGGAGGEDSDVIVRPKKKKVFAVYMCSLGQSLERHVGCFFVAVVHV